MQKNNPSIKSIAEEAGVSIATVSRVLNTPDKVNPQMRARVEQAIARNNYPVSYTHLDVYKRQVPRSPCPMLTTP